MKLKMKDILKQTEFYVFCIIVAFAFIIQVRSGQFFTSTNNNDCSNKYFFPIYRNPKQNQTIGNHCKKQGSKKAPPKCTNTTNHTRSTKNNCCNNKHFFSGIFIRQIKIRHHCITETCNSCNTAIHNKNHKSNFANIDTRPLCADFISSNRIHTSSCHCIIKNEICN